MIDSLSPIPMWYCIFCLEYTGTCSQVRARGNILKYIASWCEPPVHAKIGQPVELCLRPADGALPPASRRSFASGDFISLLGPLRSSWLSHANIGDETIETHKSFLAIMRRWNFSSKLEYMLSSAANFFGLFLTTSAENFPTRSTPRAVSRRILSSEISALSIRSCSISLTLKGHNTGNRSRPKFRYCSRALLFHIFFHTLIILLTSNSYFPKSAFDRLLYSSRQMRRSW